MSCSRHTPRGTPIEIGASCIGCIEEQKAATTNNCCVCKAPNSPKQDCNQGGVPNYKIICDPCYDNIHNPCRDDIPF